MWKGESMIHINLCGARVVQGMSDRATKPIVVVNCGAIPQNLVESTLFGHKKGASTGAVADHPGKFAEAHGGTLFLDEIGELPLDAQAKLLRALQEGEIEPVGATRPERVNVRVISATNRRMLGLAQSGEFREDLYYRLNVFPIYLPPLRERREEIPLLVDYFVERYGKLYKRESFAVPPRVMERLLHHRYQGNVRELENIVKRMIVLNDPLLTDRVLPLKKKRGDAPFAGVVLVGRAASNDVIIEHDSVSKLHARFEVAKDAVTVSDAGSSNGTRVGDVAVRDAAVVVKDGADVVFGACAFVVVSTAKLQDLMVKLGKTMR